MIDIFYIVGNAKKKGKYFVRNFFTKRKTFFYFSDYGTSSRHLGAQTEDRDGERPQGNL